MGFQRGLDHLLTKGVNVGVITTDRAPSIRKIMKEMYSVIRHEFDAWHVNKSKLYLPESQSVTSCFLICASLKSAAMLIVISPSF